MRRLEVRNISGAEGNERGATSVMVALLMVALLGFAAISIDVGKLYWEKAQLQNAADAGALALAGICGKDESDVGGCSNASGVPLELAVASSNDALSLVSNSVDKLANTATVSTRSSETGATPNSVSLWFAQALGFDEAAIGARATAAWGGPTGGAFAFPLAFSECALHEFIATSAAASGKSWLKYKDDDDQLPCSSIYHAANIVPGGWGYLNPEADAPGASDGACVLTLDLTDTTVYEGSAGNSIPGSGSECKAKLDGWVGEAEANGYAEVYFPIFSKVTTPPGGGNYTIQGIAAFRVYAWKLSGGGTPETFEADSYPGCSGNCRGVYGEFVRMLDEDELTGGGGRNLGVTRPPSLSD